MKTLLRAMLLSALLEAGAAQAQAVAPACDRACLETAASAYLDALVAHDRSKLALAATVRFTENGQVLALGDGLWGTASSLGSYRHFFADPEAGQAAVITTVSEGTAHSILAARLRVDGAGRVSEIETIVARPQGEGFLAKGADWLEERKAPEPLWLEALPASERMPRDELARVANMYFAGLEKNDGKGVYPFTEDCNRIENGFQTTNRTDDAGSSGAGIMKLGCKAQFETGFFRFVDRIRDRRFVLVDAERGVVFTLVFFDHSATVPKVTMADGRTVDVFVKTPLTWEIAEAFRVEKGRIRRVEAVLTQAPYGMKPNWP